MDIKINKDIAKEYPDDTIKGFSVMEVICIGTAAIVALGIIYVLYHYVGLSIHAAVYGAFPVAAPICIVGFFRYAGMTLPDAFRQWLRVSDQPVLCYQACEDHYDFPDPRTLYLDNEDDYNLKHKKSHKKDEKERMRKRRFGKKGGK